MIVAGWADGYRNNTFRTFEALGAAGTPWRLLAGPWATPTRRPRCPGRGSTSTSRWPRSSTRGCADARRRARGRPTSSSAPRPSPSPTSTRGFWITGPWPSPPPSRRPGRSTGRARCRRPRLGTAAWIDCAGHLPWGLSGDQRLDDARSLTWEWARADPVVGQPRVRLRLSRRRPGGLVVGEALRRLPRRHLGADHPRHAGPAFRDGFPTPAPLYRERSTTSPGARRLRLPARRRTRLRVSIAGADWPNTVAPPGAGDPGRGRGHRRAPRCGTTAALRPGFTPGRGASTEDPTGSSGRSPTTC